MTAYARSHDGRDNKKRRRGTETEGEADRLCGLEGHAVWQCRGRRRSTIIEYRL